MKANEFVKKYGLYEAKRLLQRADGCKRISVRGVYCFEYDELKLLIESHELVEKHGGLFSSKVQLDKFGFSGGLEWYGLGGEYGLTDDNDLKQAIKDVESCQ